MVYIIKRVYSGLLKIESILSLFEDFRRAITLSRLV